MFRAKDPISNASLKLTLFEDDLVNRFDMTNSAGKRQTIWFRAEVPVRTWNSMCLLRDTGRFIWFTIQSLAHLQSLIVQIPLDF